MNNKDKNPNMLPNFSKDELRHIHGEKSVKPDKSQAPDPKKISPPKPKPKK